MFFTLCRFCLNLGFFFGFHFDLLFFCSQHCRNKLKLQACKINYNIYDINYVLVHFIVLIHSLCTFKTKCSWEFFFISTERFSHNNSKLLSYKQKLPFFVLSLVAAGSEGIIAEKSSCRVHLLINAFISVCH